MEISMTAQPTKREKKGRNPRESGGIRGQRTGSKVKEVEKGPNPGMLVVGGEKLCKESRCQW